MSATATDGAAGSDPVLHGVGYMFLATAALSLQDVLGKTLVERYPVIEVLAVRAVVGVVVVGGFVHVRWGLGSLRTRHLAVHLFRSSCLLGSFLLFYRSLRDLPLADATAIFFGSPLFMAILGRVVLRERLSRTRAVVLLLGFVGVLIVVHPSPDGVEPAALLVLGASFLYPAAAVTTRSLSRHDSAQSMLAWMLVLQTIAAGAVSAFVWESPTVGGWAAMSGIGILSIVGHAALILAFSRAPVAVLAPIEYLALVFAAVFGFAIWGDVPNVAFWVGAPIIVAASLIGTRIDRTPPKMVSDTCPDIRTGV